MAKIRLVLELNGVKANSVLVTGDESVFEDTFYKMVDVLNSAARPKRSRVIQSNTSERVIERTQRDFDNNSNHHTWKNNCNNEEKPVVAINTDKKSDSAINIEQPPAQYKKTILRRGKSSLVGFKCSECGEIIIRKGEVDDAVLCRQCSCVNNIPDNLIFTKAKCPNCNHETYMYTSEDFNELKCIECESPIDLKFVEKMGCKISL